MVGVATILLEKGPFRMFSSSLFKLSILFRILFLALGKKSYVLLKREMLSREIKLYTWYISIFPFLRCLVFYLLIVCMCI